MQKFIVKVLTTALDVDYWRREVEGHLAAGWRVVPGTIGVTMPAVPATAPAPTYGHAVVFLEKDPWLPEAGPEGGR